MPGKQHVRLRLPRYSLIIAAAALLLAMVGWVAVRSAGPSKSKSPMLIVPKTTTSVVPAAAYATPFSFSPPPPPAEAPALAVEATKALPSPSSSSSPSSSLQASPSASPSKSVTPTTPPPAVPVLTASYRTTASWEQGFIGWLRVKNTGTTAASWTVKLTFRPRSGVKLGPVWNAGASTSGNTITFTGGPLAAGATADAGFSAEKSSRGPVSPASCTVAGATCAGD